MLGVSSPITLLITGFGTSPMGDVDQDENTCRNRGWPGEGGKGYRGVFCRL
jgi:hypothetical protein